MKLANNCKSPAIVDSTADLDKAAGRIMRSKINDFGQVSSSLDYLLISESVQEEFISKCKNLIKEAFYQNNKCDMRVFPPIDGQQNFERLNYLFEDAIHQGAIVELGGKFKKELWRIHPTILTHVPLTAAMMQEEILGPIIPVYTYRRKNEAINFIKQFNTPAAYYLFSESNYNINYMFDMIKSEGVFINDLLPEAFQATRELSFKYLVEIA